MFEDQVQSSYNSVKISPLLHILKTVPRIRTFPMPLTPQDEPPLKPKNEFGKRKEDSIPTMVALWLNALKYH